MAGRANDHTNRARREGHRKKREARGAPRAVHPYSPESVPASEAGGAHSKELQVSTTT